eukprot:251242-Prorocentrum_minimum.AAC.3
MPNTTVLLVIVQRSSPDIPNSIVLLAVVKESQPGYSYFDLSIGGRLRVSAQKPSPDIPNATVLSVVVSEIPIPGIPNEIVLIGGHMRIPAQPGYSGSYAGERGLKYASTRASGYVRERKSENSSRRFLTQVLLLTVSPSPDIPNATTLIGRRPGIDTRRFTADAAVTKTALS